MRAPTPALDIWPRKFADSAVWTTLNSNYLKYSFERSNSTPFFTHPVLDRLHLRRPSKDPTDQGRIASCCPQSISQRTKKNEVNTRLIVRKREHASACRTHASRSLVPSIPDISIPTFSDLIPNVGRNERVFPISWVCVYQNESFVVGRSAVLVEVEVFVTCHSGVDKTSGARIDRFSNSAVGIGVWIGRNLDNVKFFMLAVAYWARHCRIFRSDLAALFRVVTDKMATF